VRRGSGSRDGFEFAGFAFALRSLLAEDLDGVVDAGGHAVQFAVDGVEEGVFSVGKGPKLGMEVDHDDLGEVVVLEVGGGAGFAGLGAESGGLGGVGAVGGKGRGGHGLAGLLRGGGLGHGRSVENARAKTKCGLVRGL
jgi:hypothetical protein